MRGPGRRPPTPTSYIPAGPVVTEAAAATTFRADQGVGLVSVNPVSAPQRNGERGESIRHDLFIRFA